MSVTYNHQNSSSDITDCRKIRVYLCNMLDVNASHDFVRAVLVFIFPIKEETTYLDGLGWPPLVALIPTECFGGHVKMCILAIRDVKPRQRPSDNQKLTPRVGY